MSGKLFHVGDNDGAVLLPCCAAHAAAPLDAVARHRALERSKLQLAIVDDIESRPPGPNSLVDEGGGVRQLANGVALPFNQALDLLGQ